MTANRYCIVRATLTLNFKFWTLSLNWLIETLSNSTTFFSNVTDNCWLFTEHDFEHFQIFIFLTCLSASLFLLYFQPISACFCWFILFWVNLNVYTDVLQKLGNLRWRLCRISYVIPTLYDVIVLDWGRQRKTFWTHYIPSGYKIYGTAQHENFLATVSNVSALQEAVYCCIKWFRQAWNSSQWREMAESSLTSARVAKTTKNTSKANGTAIC